MPFQPHPTMPIRFSGPRARTFLRTFVRTLAHSSARIATLACLFAITACAVLEPEPGAADRRALSRNRALWQRMGPQSYRYVYLPRCGECAPNYQRATWVTVQRGIVVDAEYVDGGEPVLTGPQVYATVDSLFALVERAYDNHAADVRVSYDATLGYPTEVWIDWRRDMADEEGGFFASSLAAYAPTVR